MHEVPMLRDLVVLLAASVPIVFLFHRLRIPTLVGFLAAGVLLGPHGFGAISSPEAVERVAELGIVLLLFVIGLELSLGGVARVGGRVLLAGVLQVIVTGALAYAIASAGGLPWRESVLIGFLAVHSSTVVALKILSDRGQIDAPQGRIATGILLLQDLCAVAMVLLVPLLAEGREVSAGRVLGTLASAALVVAGILASARVLLPWLLRHVAALRVRELFTVAVVVLSLGTAWLAGELGLSLAIGALIAGLVLSGSEYSHQVLAEILPMRDIFSSLFFISIGMLLRPAILVEQAGQLLALTGGAIALKVLVVVAVVAPIVRSLRVAVLVGVCLGQVGELALVLARLAAPSGLLPASHYGLFVATAVLSFVVSPFLVEPAERLGFRLAGRARRGAAGATGAPGERSGPQVLVVGYGLNGRNLTRVLRETGIAYRVLELNPKSVSGALREGEPIVFGDGTRPDVLRAAGIEQAEIVVIGISDPASTRRITTLARTMSAEATLIVRTRYVSEIDELYRLGATEVIPEEFETSVEIFARVLRRLHVPRNVINLQIELVRGESYGMLRGLSLPSQNLRDVQSLLAATLTETYLVEPDSPAVGETIGDLRLRQDAGVTIIAVVRAGEPHVNPGPDLQVAADDVLVLLGSHAELEQAFGLLAPPRPV